jgi:ribonuclease HI
MPELRAANEWIAQIDGASRGNPGPAAAAVVITTADGRPVASFAKFLGRSTNNFAEYQALLAALQYGIQHEQRRLRVRSDSELLVRQILGSYKVRSDGLRPLHQRALKLIRAFEAFSISHVPREHNREADRLASQALDSGKDIGLDSRNSKLECGLSDVVRS